MDLRLVGTRGGLMEDPQTSLRRTTRTATSCIVTRRPEIDRTIETATAQRISIALIIAIANTIGVTGTDLEWRKPFASVSRK